MNKFQEAFERVESILKMDLYNDMGWPYRFYVEEELLLLKKLVSMTTCLDEDEQE